MKFNLLFYFVFIFNLLSFFNLSFAESKNNIVDNQKVKWNLQITYTSYEVKNFILPHKKYKPFLPKTAWRCLIHLEKERNNIFSRSLVCNYSVKKRGEFRTTLSCSKENPYNELQFELYDQRKDLLYKIFLFCEIKTKNAINKK